MLISFNFFLEQRFQGTNQLKVDFTSPVEAAKKLSLKLEHQIPPKCPPPMYNGECHMNLLRKMQASFAWDWGLAAPSMGLWKNVYLEKYDSIFIRDITYQLIDGTDSEDRTAVDDDVWTLKVSAFIETGLKKATFKGVIACKLT